MIVTEDAYPYLVAQRGALHDMKGDSTTWLNQYFDVISSEFRSITPFLPRRCASILDIGGGMGGIDCFINQHFGGDCQLTILDGVDDPPEVTQHSKTFNHMSIARQFLAANGVANFDFIDANSAHRRAIRKYDLVVSFKSWCFHYEPSQYLDLVVSACHSESILLIDVRRDKPEWFDELCARLRFVGVAYAGVKFETCRFGSQQ